MPSVDSLHRWWKWAQDESNGPRRPQQETVSLYCEQAFGFNPLTERDDIKAMAPAWKKRAKYRRIDLADTNHLTAAWSSAWQIHRQHPELVHMILPLLPMEHELHAAFKKATEDNMRKYSYRRK